MYPALCKSRAQAASAWRVRSPKPKLRYPETSKHSHKKKFSSQSQKVFKPTQAYCETLVLFIIPVSVAMGCSGVFSYLAHNKEIQLTKPERF